MKPEDITPGKRYVIDTAPLVASPEGGKGSFIGEVSTAHAKPSDGRFYVFPETHGSPLYISAHWFIREAR